MRRGVRGLAWLALLTVAAALAHPVQPTPTRDEAIRAAARDCGSTVVRRCEPGARAESRTAEIENRRIESITTDLGRVVIEGRRERPPSVEAIIAGRLATPPPPPGPTYNVEDNAGVRCTCMTRCPPWPLPCCQCSAPPDRPTRSY